MLIRFALKHERAALEALQRRASLANEGDREALLAHPDAIDLPLAQIEAGQVLVAERGSALAGFAAVLPREDGDAELDGLFVEPALWRSGVARALVERCCRLGREHGAKTLHVLGNPHALGFYTACGFEAVGSRPMRFGTAVVMRRRL